MTTLAPFHLAVPVYDLEKCRHFYREIIGCSEGRSSDKWVDFNFFGHQLVIHQVPAVAKIADAPTNPVDGKHVPVPHFGVVLNWNDWEAFAARLIAQKIDFVIEPHIRFQGEVGEQATLFFMDPDGNALEFKAFKDLSQLFCKMTPINIRPATKEDLPSILEILNHAIINTTAVYNYHPYTLAMIEEWYAEKMATNAPVFVSTQQHIVTGYVTYGPYRTRPAYKYTKEHSIYVHPNYRRQGIAKQLMTTIIQAAKNADIHSLIGGIDEENQVSIAFHKEFGFVEVGNLKQVGFKFGHWLNLVFVQLILETPLHPSDDL